MADSYNVSDVKFIGLNVFDARTCSDIEEVYVKEQGDQVSSFQFKFESYGDLAFTGISTKGILRADGQAQRQILSIVDTSPESDKESIMFCGDLFNFHLGKELDLEGTSQKVTSILEEECSHYFECLSNMRGFPKQQFIFCSSDAGLFAKHLELSKSLLPDASASLEQITREQKYFKLMAEHRLFQPIMNYTTPRITRAIQLLGLDPQYPPHVVRFMWAMREKI